MELLNRVWKTQFPPEPPKTANALRFGVLGAANIT